MNQYYINLLLLVLAIWTIPWKAYAIWTAVKRDNKKWFVVFLLLNTVSILEIIYIFKIVKKSWAEVKTDFNNAWKSLFQKKDIQPVK